MRLLPLGAALVMGLAGGACAAALQDTPAQQRAWREWERCRSAVYAVQLLSVDADGRLRLQVASGFDRIPVLACLGPEAGGLPEPVFVPRPVGP